LSAFLLIDIPWFLTEGKLAAIFINSSKPSLGVYQLAGHLLQANKFSGTIITAPSVSYFHKI
jgi:hypothetical protein